MSAQIFAKIADAMADIEAISKARKNTQQNYQFRGIDDVYNELHPLLSKHRIFTVPEVLEDRHEERTSKSGGINIYRVLKMRYTFYADDGSSVAAVVIGEGMDSGDKASNKAMSVAHKYALLQIFAIPTDDDKDPENDSHTVTPRAPKPQPKPQGQTSPQESKPSGKPKTPRGAMLAEIGGIVTCEFVSDDERKVIRERCEKADLRGLEQIRDEWKVMVDKRASGQSVPFEDDIPWEGGDGQH
jgi:hypothetical protein